MDIIKTPIRNLLILIPGIIEDERGYFFESYNQSKLNEKGLDFRFVQDNQSKSRYGTIRGLHYQKEPYAQTKLVRVISGKIFDVAVDMRKSSPDFGKWFGCEISAENKKQLLVPKGFAHGFSVLSETAEVLYKCDEYYHPEAEGGISYKDPGLQIDWMIDSGSEIISPKDSIHPFLKDSDYHFE